MGEVSESDKSFIGLLAYAATHLFCLYYLLWILIKSIADYAKTNALSSLQKDLLGLQPYFPTNTLRIIVPASIFGAFVLFSAFSYGWMAKKRREYGSVFDQKQNQKSANSDKKEVCK